MKIFGGKPSAGINTPGIRRKESKLSLIIAFVAALGLPIGGIALFSLLGNNKNISTPLVSSQRPLDYVETKPDIPYIHERLLPELVLDREEFVQEVLRDLHKDLNSVPLSRFILRSSFIDKNIEIVSKGHDDPLLDADAELNKYAKIKLWAEQWIAKHKTVKARLEGLHYFMHYHLLRGYLKGEDNVVDLFDTGIYNCVSSILALSMLEYDLVKSDQYGVVLLDPGPRSKSGHIRSWFFDGRRYWEIENTSGCPPRMRAFRKGLRVPKQIIIAAWLVRNGVGVDELPVELARYYKLGVDGSGFPVAGAKTDLPEPPEGFQPNPFYRKTEKEIKKILEEWQKIIDKCIKECRKAGEKNCRKVCTEKPKKEKIERRRLGRL